MKEIFTNFRKNENNFPKLLETETVLHISQRIVSNILQYDESRLQAMGNP